METSVCQRWLSGRHSWRPAGELFDPAAFEVAPTRAAAEVRAFVRAHHYARSCGSTVRLFGLHGRGSRLVGVAVFSSPQVDAVLRPWGRADALELGRLVLLDEVEGNAESWFVRRALDLLAREGWAGVVSFSDPEPRVDARPRRALRTRRRPRRGVGQRAGGRARQPRAPAPAPAAAEGDVTDPFTLGGGAAVAWCEANGVSWAGLRCLRLATSQTTSYRWDAARRGYVRSRVGEPEAFLEHDFIERALPARATAPPAASPDAGAPVAVAPTPARPSTARALPAPRPEPRAEQLGLFGGGGR